MVGKIDHGLCYIFFCNGISIQISVCLRGRMDQGFSINNELVAVFRNFMLIRKCKLKGREAIKPAAKLCNTAELEKTI